MKTKLSTLALAVMASAALADSGSDEPGVAGAYNLQEPEATEYKTKPPGKARGELYGFAMIDMGYNDGTINSKWYDVVRPTQLPSNRAQVNGLEGDFTTPGSVYASVRQSRLGVKGWFPTDRGEIHTIFEFEMFGTGDDAGQTTFRLRHAYGEMGAFGGGQYWSPFMDINVFPNSVEYWGPTGMAFTRSIQFRWMPIRGEENNLTFALEKPGAGRDPSVEELDAALAERNVRARYPVPDLSAAYSFTGNWGYVRIAGILRYIKWEDETPGAAVDLSDDAVGYGLNFSTNIKIGPRGSVIKLAIVGGEAIQNYMNDGTGDIGLQTTGNSIEAAAIPMLGTTLFYDLYWADRWSSSFGFSTLDIDNRDLENAANFKSGRYALAHVLYHPADNVMFGGEVQYGSRENFDDGWDYDLWRIQFSARYNFSFGLGG